VSKVIDLTIERAERGPAVTRFTLEARDVGPRHDGHAYAWTWCTEDNLDAHGQKPATKQHVAQMLRRVADRYDPRPKQGRAKVTARAKRGHRA
jgi:hypothetical protein